MFTFDDTFLLINGSFGLSLKIIKIKLNLKKKYIIYFFFLIVKIIKKNKNKPFLILAIFCDPKNPLFDGLDE